MKVYSCPVKHTKVKTPIRYSRKLSCYCLSLLVILALTLSKATAAASDLAPQLANTFVQFDLKVMTPPTNPDANWLFKIEAGKLEEAVEIVIESDSQHGQPAQVGEWRAKSINKILL